jgi:rRNA maturation RNase YbeY
MDKLIQFFSEEVDFSLADEKNVITWLLEAIQQENLETGVINIIFCTDDYLLDLNQRFLERDTLTDVIAFEYGEEGKEVSGDIFISIERIHDNAAALGNLAGQEVLRVIIHGLLHICGYADKTPEQKASMTLREDKYLSLLPH